MVTKFPSRGGHLSFLCTGGMTWLQLALPAWHPLTHWGTHAFSRNQNFTSKLGSEPSRSTLDPELCCLQKRDSLSYL